MNSGFPRLGRASQSDPEVLDALARVLDSRGFRSSLRLGRFLRFVVERTLEGREDEIKEYVIATEVYGKSPDYDPQIDSSVRVEASRLRSRLREYYEGEGSADRVRIELPRGRYIPVFGRPPAQFPASPAIVPVSPPQRPALEAAERESSRLVLGWRGLAALITVGLAAIGGSLWFYRLDPPPRQSEPFRITPITADPGREMSASISPDGQQVAFAWSRFDQTKSDIFVKRLDAQIPLRITAGLAVENSPAWSPDGSRIAFLRSAGGEGSVLVLAPPLGGSERVVAEVNVAPTSGISWSPDGLLVAVIEFLGEGPSSRPVLTLVSVKTGEKRTAQPSLTGLNDASSPAFSPDGETIAFLGSSDDLLTGLYLAELDEDTVKRLASLNELGDGVTWTRDGLELLVGRRTPMRTRWLWRVQANGGEVTKLELGSNPSQPSVSPDGTRLAFTERSSEFDIVRYRTDGSVSPQDRAHHLIASTRFDGNPQYSPNGEFIAFSTGRSGDINIWICQPDGSHALQLTSIGNAGSPRW